MFGASWTHPISYGTSKSAGETTHMPAFKMMVINQHGSYTLDSSHYIHCKLVGTMVNDGSIWPSTCGR